MRASTIAALLAGIAAASLTGPAAAMPGGPSPAVTAPDGLLTTVRAKRHHRIRRSARMPSGSRFNNVTRGAIGGDSGGNAVTGSTAAPSGR
jgi:hypothetical protein